MITGGLMLDTYVYYTELTLNTTLIVLSLTLIVYNTNVHIYIVVSISMIIKSTCGNTIPIRI
jgi:hypothetical protein